MAGELGFKPRLTDSKSVVLPLHYSPTDARWRMRDSNSQFRLAKPMLSHLTNPQQPGTQGLLQLVNYL